MSLSSVIKKKHKFLLPLSWLYLAGIKIYHTLYNYKILKTHKPGLPVIVVGNLAVGGTGKTPMVEYLIRLLHKKYAVGTISRGYKRKSRGYLVASEHTTVMDIGDEPMQFHFKFPGITVCVGEERWPAIQQLVKERPVTELIILDDAFQHRAVSAGLNIVLTAYDNLFVDDFYLPSGQLRDEKANYKRAEIIIVTKCKSNLSVEESKKIISKIKPFPYQVVYFTTISYEKSYHLFHVAGFDLNQAKEVILISGIANPKPLMEYLLKYNLIIHNINFSDHYQYSKQDVINLTREFHGIPENSKIILTTEKDAMRLMPYKDELQHLPIYAIPVLHQFLFDAGKDFDDKILSFISSFNSSPAN